MSAWVLVIYVWWSHVALDHVDMPDQATCKQAAEVLKERMGSGVTFSCIDRVAK